MSVERATVARPRLGNPSPIIPARVLEAAQDYRSGKISLADANRCIGGPGKRVRTAVGGDDRRRRAMEGRGKRLDAYRASQKKR